MTKRRSCQDLKAASVLIVEDDMRETTLFHLQQSIEKALKAYLIWSSVNFPHTHDLEILVDIAIEKDADFVELNAIIPMTDFVVAGRYPESDQWLDDCEPVEWIELIRQACDFIWLKIET